MSDNLYEYETLVEQALRGVVRDALKQAGEHGLTDDHHFFITFHTDFPGVEMPEYLREKYPDEMTIVLQYQFDELTIKNEWFSVILSFNNVPEKKVVPFDAITGFADPSVKFGLQFHVTLDDLEDFEDEEFDQVIGEKEPKKPLEESKEKKADAKPKKSGSKSSKSKKSKKEDGDQDNVVSLDHFRK